MKPLILLGILGVTAVIAAVIIVKSRGKSDESQTQNNERPEQKNKSRDKDKIANDDTKKPNDENKNKNIDDKINDTKKQPNNKDNIDDVKKPEKNNENNIEKSNSKPQSLVNEPQPKKVIQVDEETQKESKKHKDKCVDTIKAIDSQLAAEIEKIDMGSRKRFANEGQKFYETIKRQSPEFAAFDKFYENVIVLLDKNDLIYKKEYEEKEAIRIKEMEALAEESRKKDEERKQLQQLKAETIKAGKQMTAEQLQKMEDLETDMKEIEQKKQVLQQSPIVVDQDDSSEPNAPGPNPSGPNPPGPTPSGQNLPVDESILTQITQLKQLPQQLQPNPNKITFPTLTELQSKNVDFLSQISVAGSNQICQIPRQKNFDNKLTYFDDKINEGSIVSDRNFSRFIDKFNDNVAEELYDQTYLVSNNFGDIYEFFKKKSSDFDNSIDKLDEKIKHSIMYTNQNLNFATGDVENLCQSFIDVNQIMLHNEKVQFANNIIKRLDPIIKQIEQKQSEMRKGLNEDFIKQEGQKVAKFIKQFDDCAVELVNCLVTFTEALTKLLDTKQLDITIMKCNQERVKHKLALLKSLEIQITNFKSQVNTNSANLTTNDDGVEASKLIVTQVTAYENSITAKYQTILKNSHDEVVKQFKVIFNGLFQKPTQGGFVIRLLGYFTRMHEIIVQTYSDAGLAPETALLFTNIATNCVGKITSVNRSQNNTTGASKISKPLQDFKNKMNGIKKNDREAAVNEMIVYVKDLISKHTIDTDHWIDETESIRQAKLLNQVNDFMTNNYYLTAIKDFGPVGFDFCMCLVLAK